MKRIGETMAGVFAADLAMKFFDTALEGAKKLAEFMKESGIMGAQMEQMQAQLKIQLPESTTPKQIEQLTNTLQYFADTTPFQLKNVFDSFRELLVARVGVTGMDPKTGKYTGADVSKVMEVIQEIGNIAAATVPPGKSPSEHYAEIASVIQKSLLGGNLMERTLRPLEQLGVEVRPWLESKYGLVKGSLGALGSEEDTEALHTLYKMIKKGEVPAFSILEMLKDVTGKGGKYEGAAATLSQTAIGGFSTMMDKFENIMRGIGKIELGPFEDIVNKINSSFTPEAYTKIQDFFDKASEKSKAWMDAHMGMFTNVFGKFFETLGKQDWSTVVASLEKAVEAFGKMLEKSQPILDFIAKDIPQEIEDFTNLISGIERVAAAIERAFGWVTRLSNVDVEKVQAQQTTSEDVRRAKGEYERLVSQQETSHNVKQSDIDAAQKRWEDLSKAQTEQKTKIEGLNKSVSDLDKQVKKTTGNDFVHLEKAIESTTAAFGNFAAVMGQATIMGGMGGAVAGGGAGVTEYGPGVAGDQPGQTTYDKYSYNRVGAWPGITGPLRAGDVALGYGAQAHYNVSPGQMFIDDQGRTVRFADRSGSRNPMNEDIFRLASGGIVHRATRALIGEAGPEAVVPLNQGGLVTLNYNPVFQGPVGDIENFLRDHADALLRQVEHALSSRFASMANV